MSFALRCALPVDIDAIQQIQCGCVEAPHWSGGVWQRVLTPNTEVLRTCFVAESDGVLCGFLVASCAGPVAELESVAVAVAARRQGVARALCLKAMAWAQELDAETMQLEVRVVSGPALSLYRALGFAEEGRRTQYYRDPVADAVLMSVALKRNLTKV